jgi:hypothetical protein
MDRRFQERKGSSQWTSRYKIANAETPEKMANASIGEFEGFRSSSTRSLAR